MPAPIFKRRPSVGDVPSTTTAMGSPPRLILKLRSSLGLPDIRDDPAVVREYRVLLSRAIVICEISRTLKKDNEDFLRYAHDILNDTITLAYSDQVVERFDSRSRACGSESLMELAQWDARNLELEQLTVGRLDTWEVAV